ncbi:MAG: aminotransferase class I/II-fold pyridoxal phosphate-dependent enzyme [bacterium]|nr:aminotransferase class I/II-fold pyridoxal phosphate-dependent enzyme [bacterium]
MRKFITEKVSSIKPSGIRRFFDIASEMEGVISLGVGEPDFDTPWHIREEGIYSLERGNTFYTSNAGLKDLRIEVTNYIKRRFNLDYDPLNEVFITVGGSEAIDACFRACVENGDEVIIPEPCYVSYAPCATLAGAKVVTIDLKEENEFKLTKEELLNAITPKTKILVLAFPNNPTGSIMGKEELEEIAKIAIEKDILVLSDEIYAELTYGVKHYSIAQIDGMRNRTIVVNGFSKAYAMTGWRLGFAYGPSEIIKQMLKIHQFAIMCAPTTSQFAAVEALRNGDNDIAEMRMEYNQRRRYLVNKLREMGFDCFEPKGAFYVFPSIKKFGLKSEEFCEKLLMEEKVMVVPGTAFGKSGEGFIRISYAYSLDQLKRAMERIERFVKKLK